MLRGQIGWTRDFARTDRLDYRAVARTERLD
jgi:hypothetical protein